MFHEVHDEVSVKRIKVFNYLRLTCVCVERAVQKPNAAVNAAASHARTV